MVATLASNFTNGPVLSIINKRLRNLCKPINKVQEEVILSKPTIIAQIDELEKLRQPLAAAISEEVDLTIQRHQESLRRKSQRLWVLQNDFTSTMLTRTHERGCCLTYDFVTDDVTNLLVGGLLILRPVDSSLSHQNALQRCIEHAKLWLQNSNYLNKIMASDCFTTMSEMKCAVVVAAAAIVGNYASFQVHVHGSISTIPMPDLRFMHALSLNQFLLTYPSHIILILTLLYFPESLQGMSELEYLQVRG
ncbi:hypothetical protein UlMin_000839 [Ulmus minor]